jgi:hypothetical protein
MVIVPTSAGKVLHVLPSIRHQLPPKHGGATKRLAPTRMALGFAEAGP